VVTQPLQIWPTRDRDAQPAGNKQAPHLGRLLSCADQLFYGKTCRVHDVRVGIQRRLLTEFSAFIVNVATKCLFLLSLILLIPFERGGPLYPTPGACVQMFGRSFWIESLQVVVLLVCVRCVAGTSIHLQIVMSGSMRPQIQVGDVVITVGSGGNDSYAVGDIITFQPSKDSELPSVIHRIISTERNGRPCILTKGDNNPVDDHRGGIYGPGERCVAPENILTRYRGQIPLPFVGPAIVWIIGSFGATTIRVGVTTIRVGVISLALAYSAIVK
jgi:signal peptidase I